MKCATRNLYLSPMNDIGICEIDVKHDIVFIECRTEQQRPLPIETQFKTGQKSSALVIEAVRTSSMRMDIAVSIE